MVARDAIGCAKSPGNIQRLLVGYQNKTALQVDRGVNSSNASSCETIEVWLLLLSAIDVPDVAAQLACKVEFEAVRVLDYRDFLSGLRRCILLAQAIIVYLADVHQTDPENLIVPFPHAPCSTVDTRYVGCGCALETALPRRIRHDPQSAKQNITAKSSAIVKLPGSDQTAVVRVALITLTWCFA